MSEPDLRRLDDRPVPAPAGEIRASLIVRNESLRLPAVLDHHRRLGVDRFVVVDNGSEDGTVELLLAQPDVHVFYTEEPFHPGKEFWRRALMEDFFRDCWSLHLDGDELFVHPGAEQISLRRFCDFLEQEGAAGIFAVMVDMYAEEPVERVVYRPGEPLLERFPYFDPGGYRLRFRGRKRRGQVAPAYQVSGGPRERLFFERGAGRLSRALATRFYDIRRRAPHPLTRVPLLGSQLNSIARRALPDYMPACGKVPLLRWEPALGIETSCMDTFHEVVPAIPLSSCWAALLHFKYVQELRDQARKMEERWGGVEYTRYLEVMDEKEELVLYGPHSVRYESTAQLVEAGLMRVSPELEALLSDAAGPS